MLRGIAFAGLAVAMLVVSGCATSRKITTRSELGNIGASRRITVYSQERQIYELRDHARADSVIRGWGTVSKGGRTSSFQGTITLTAILAVKTNSKSALQGLVFPSMNSALSKIVAANEQGELQGGVASLQSVSAIVGPPLLTGALAHFTGPAAPVHFPGAAFLLSSLLAMTAFTIIALFARGVFAQIDAARREAAS